MKTNAYLEITMKITDSNREKAAKVYSDYKEPFLKNINGALTKSLLIRDEDVQVLHGFDSIDNAKLYLESDLFKQDVFTSLKPLLSDNPEVKIYSVI